MKIFNDLDRKTALIVCLLILSTVFSAYSAYNTYEFRQIIIGAKPAPAKPALKRPSEYKIGIDYAKALESEKPMLLLFYADWCHFCIDFMPKYEALYKKYKNKYNFVKINVEDPAYIKEVEKYEIAGFPTVFLVNPKTDKHIQLENQNFGNMEILKKNLEDFYKENK